MRNCVFLCSSDSFSSTYLFAFQRCSQPYKSCPRSRTVSNEFQCWYNSKKFVYNVWRIVTGKIWCSSSCILLVYTTCISVFCLVSNLYTTMILVNKVWYNSCRRRLLCHYYTYCGCSNFADAIDDHIYYTLNAKPPSAKANSVTTENKQSYAGN